MDAFKTLTGRAAPLRMSNVDTDMIIPKQYLKTIKRTGLGYAAFAELRYENSLEVAAHGPEAGIEKADFIGLNRQKFKDCLEMFDDLWSQNSSKIL